MQPHQKQRCFRKAYEHRCELCFTYCDTSIMTIKYSQDIISVSYCLLVEYYVIIKLSVKYENKRETAVNFAVNNLRILVVWP